MNHNGWPYLAQYPHCSGCRCFASTTWTHTLTTPTYVPRHRKPGPAH